MPSKLETVGIIATAKALYDSMEHWYRMAYNGRKSGENHYSDSCACCRLLFRAGTGKCRLCPLTVTTKCCDGLWEDADLAYICACSSWVDAYNSPAFKEAARNMHRFIQKKLQAFEKTHRKTLSGE